MRSGERAGESLHDKARVCLELAVRKAEGAVAGARERRVAAAVAFECLAGAVVAPAVGFDREAVLREEESTTTPAT